MALRFTGASTLSSASIMYGHATFENPAFEDATMSAKYSVHAANCDSKKALLAGVWGDVNMIFLLDWGSRQLGNCAVQQTNIA